MERLVHTSVPISGRNRSPAERCNDEFKLKHGYFCELPKGHLGEHEATCPNAEFHQQWPNEPSAERAAEFEKAHDRALEEVSDEILTGGEGHAYDAGFIDGWQAALAVGDDPDPKAMVRCPCPGFIEDKVLAN